MPSSKEAAKRFIYHLPEQATWDDIMYELYVKQKIERRNSRHRVGAPRPPRGWRALFHTIELSASPRARIYARANDRVS